MTQTDTTQMLSERVIMVTGAGQGIGAAVAKALAGAGATVVLSDRKVSALERIYDDIKAGGGPEPAIAPMNLEALRWDEAATLIQRLSDELGRLDGLLHNAAHFPALTPLANLTLEQWYQTLQINLNAAFILTRACLPLLQTAPDASILFTGDRAGRQGKAYYGAYGVSKFAIEGLMQTLAEETETNTAVRVNSIDPGEVRTELYERLYPGRLDQPIARPQDIVRPYLFLLGPQSRGITGRLFEAQGEGPWIEKTSAANDDG